jgi:hypothetical protein
MSQRTYLRSEQKERFWRRALRRQAGCGTSVREFCRREALKESAFYFWKRTIAQRDRQKLGSPRSAKKTSGKRRAASANGKRGNGKAVRAAATFMPLKLLGEKPRLEMLSPDGWQVRVPEGVDSQALCEVVAALRSVADRERS